MNNQNKSFKYLTYAILITSLLYFISINSANFDTTKALLSSSLLVVSLVVLDMFVFNSREGMEEVLQEQGVLACDSSNADPTQYLYGPVDEDYAKSGLNYDTNLPGYYLVNNGNYSEKGISYEKVQDLIIASKYNDLYNQHNFNIVWSPHTHVGKARGYLNWDKIVD
ncbi:hypothetical protein QKU48_gp0652 [Fadolivirus algeromassiliense]|jgi:hypothetical protein|uniref:Uncharacterized protein n=1 Tax=Fadolivirus FV1/VV64 TaxID=3070911 RepID=A0A7D3UT65_9VIRU|nr:hypothetical protein QKU48_gp0652 [Fadolivirus algeromassiliense]QKF94110.1 hypothetical protein Fadolivirus_1_652 [Fadolivirus FV1/VV64]